MQTSDSEKLILVASRFRRELYERLEAYARANRRSISNACAVLCEAALRECEASKQEKRLDAVKSPV